MVITECRYTTAEVCEMAGISYRQADHWCHLGLIAPSITTARGTGTRRAWSRQDLAIVRVLAAVCGHGVPINRLGQLVDYLTDLPLAQWAGTTIVLDASGAVWLASDAAPKVGLHVDLSLAFDEAR